MRLLLYCCFIILANCTEPKHLSQFAEYIDVQAITAAHMVNNSGEFDLAPEQLRRLRKDLIRMTYAHEGTFKPGAINLTIEVSGKKIMLNTQTHDIYIKTDTAQGSGNNNSNQIAFWANGVNLDNYKPIQQPYKQ